MKSSSDLKEPLLGFADGEPADPRDGDLWLDTSDIQGDVLVKWSDEVGAWCMAENEDYARAGIVPLEKE